MSNDSEKFSRNCPKCKKLLYYTEKTSLLRSIKNNTVCKKCNYIIRPRSYSPELRKRLSEKAHEKYKKFTELQWNKMREDGHKYGMLQKPLTQEEKQLRSGCGNKFYGHKHTEETKKNIGNRTRGIKLSLDHRLKISTGLIRNKVNVGESNPTKRPEVRQKIRLARIRYIESLRGQMYPIYNKRGCDFFNKLNKENGWNLQHAENGGEYYLEKLGYWLDAYDKEKNIVVEYDEFRHYHVDGKLKEKDVIRMNEIIHHLNCTFYRYNERNQNFYKIEK